MPRIFYFTPYHKDGLGKAYNEHCAIVPEDDDWIVLQDMDIMLFGSQKVGEQLELAIASFPQYQVLTCWTTRLCARCQQQIRSPGIREERDMVKLKQAVDFCAKTYVNKIVPINGFFAGYFVAFPKKLWKRFPFPEVGSQGGKILGIDSAWSRTLRQHGIRVGMMQGLLAVHFYRLDTGEANVSHLNDPTHNLKIGDRWPQGRAIIAGVYKVLPFKNPMVVSDAPKTSGPLPSHARLNPGLHIPGGTRFRDADGLWHYAEDLEKLVVVVRDYRARIGRPPGEPEQEILKQLYERYPRYFVISR